MKNTTLLTYTSILTKVSLLAALLMFNACSDSGVEDTQVTAANSSPSPTATATANTAYTANTNADLSWPQPEGWETLPASSMVLNSYQKDTPSGSLKLSISAFPGTVGGDLANISRWQRQLGLSPVTPETLATVLKEETIAGRAWKKVSLANNGNALLIAYTMSGGKSWFFKISGPTAGVEAIKESFDEFLATVKNK
jgi:hypothetical protein